MKKIVFVFCLLFALHTGFAQDKKVQISLRLAPNLSFTSITPGSSWSGSSKGSTGFRVMFGPSFDFFFAENYAFSTGLWYNVKAGNINAVYRSIPTDEPVETTVSYNLQYLTIPATIKLYTNEIMPDVRMYFQVGGTVDFKLAEKRKGGDEIKDLSGFTPGGKIFNSLNVGPYLGVGGELVLSSSNTVFAGINYSRGVIPIGGNNVADNGNLKPQSAQLALEVGLKF